MITALNSELFSTIAFLLFMLSIILLFILKKLMSFSSNIATYTQGKIPLSISCYTPRLMASLSNYLILSYNVFNPSLYVSQKSILIKVFFENEMLKSEIKSIIIFLKNNDDINLHSRKIRIELYSGERYTLFINIQEINMKKTISKFEENGFDLIIK